ncbi:MAG: S9 family peptidase, partial [Flavobacteriales bacterium]|nr:S9 family peptidase [Flavobacteriales bacterium]
MNLRLFFACALLAACGAPNDPASTPSVERLQYPETRKDSIAGDTLHGTFVSDPYRWLENDTSAATKAWVDGQNAVTNAFLEKIPFRKDIAKRYEELFNFPKVSAPIKVGDLFFQYRNSGLQNQSVIYVRKGLDGEDKVFIDPNAIDPAGTTTFNLMGASNDD